MASDGVVLTQDESGSKFFHRVLREAVDAFPRSFEDAPIPSSGKVFKKGYGDLLTRFEAARVNSPQRLEIARYLRAATAAALGFSRGGATKTLDESFKETVAAPETDTRAPSGSAGHTLEVPLDGRVYRGRDVAQAVDALFSAHHLTQRAADGLRWLVNHTGGTLDLTGHRFALLGASAELSPVQALLEAGATVRWFDVKPAGPFEAHGPLIATRGGDDLLTNPHAVAAALREFAKDGPVHVCLFAYAPGKSRELLLAGVMEALVRSLGASVVKSVSTFISPTSPREVQPEDLAVSLARKQQPKWWQRAAALTGALKAGGDVGGVARSVISLQGAAYQAAQYLTKTIAMEVLAADGLDGAPVTLSANVAGITNTRSLSHPLFQIAFQGSEAFGVRIFEPPLTRAVSGYLMVHDLLNPAAPGNASQTHGDAAARAKAVHQSQIHGAVYDLPWQFESCVQTAAVVGFTKKPGLLLKR